MLLNNRVDSMLADAKLDQDRLCEDDGVLEYRLDETEATPWREGVLELDGLPAVTPDGDRHFVLWDHEFQGRHYVLIPPDPNMIRNLPD